MPAASPCPHYIPHTATSVAHTHCHHHPRQLTTQTSSLCLLFIPHPTPPEPHPHRPIHIARRAVPLALLQNIAQIPLSQLSDPSLTPTTSDPLPPTPPSQPPPTSAHGPQHAHTQRPHPIQLQQRQNHRQGQQQPAMHQKAPTKAGPAFPVPTRVGHLRLSEVVERVVVPALAGVGGEGGQQGGASFVEALVSGGVGWEGMECGGGTGALRVRDRCCGCATNDNRPPYSSLLTPSPPHPFGSQAALLAAPWRVPSPPPWPPCTPWPPPSLSPSPPGP